MEGLSRSLHTLWTIFKQEFSLYWLSPIAYIVGGIWLFFSGVFFAFYLGQLNQSAGFGSLFGGVDPDAAIRNTLSPMAFLLMFLAPALTMRLVAEEIRSGTHELLLTSPVRDWEIIVGKWLAVWGVFTVFIVVSLLYPAVLAWRGTPDATNIVLSYVGYWLWAGAVLAAGVLASSLTQYQLIAFLISEGIALVLFLTDLFSQLITNPAIGSILGQISIGAHYQESMMQLGLLRWLDLAYFFGVIAVCLFLATQILNSRRWRA